jgi:DNA-directed RNA polymerase subunit E'/Rpb7
MNIISPYKDIRQFTKIKILPHHMNSDIRNHMKLNLKKKVEKKCNKNGFIDEVYKIENYYSGIIPAENLSGSAIYDIIYQCRLCIPVENSIIIGQIRIINQELIIAWNGPIIIFIPKENIDKNIWDIQDNFLNAISKVRLKINKFVKIQIINKKINQNDHQINSIGKLLDIATDEEVKQFYGSVIYDNDDEVVNSDEDIKEKEKEKESNFII